MKKQIKVYYLEVPIFKYKYNLVVEPKEELVKEFFDCKDSLSNVNGFFLTYKNDEGEDTKVIWVRDLKDISTLTHEILHLVFDVCRSVGIEYNNGSEEVFTYLQGFVLEQILNNRGEQVIIKF